MWDWLLEVVKQNIKMCPTTEAYTDVVELCALLQCLGFSVKSLNTSDGNMSHENGARTVIINCKEFGCSILGQLPKGHRERLSKELRVMMRCIRENSDIDVDVDKSKEKSNKSASMVEIKVSPERRLGLLKPDTPTRYRSLDTLTAAAEADQPLPTPGLLQKLVLTDTSNEEVTHAHDNKNKKMMIRRQSTYTVSPSGSVRIRNKTSSPLQQPRSVVLENLIAAEKAASGLRQQLANIIQHVADEGKDDSSMSSLALDVSKISVLKGTEPMKAQFASSPNLSDRGTVYEDMKKNKLMKLESASTSCLAPKKQTPNKDGGVTSKLRRISPNFFKKNSLSIKNDKLKPQENRSSKLSSIFKPKAVTPKLKAESSPNLSASSKKKFSHIKSTIPKPTPKKE